jgi:hypothetical protein
MVSKFQHAGSFPVGFFHATPWIPRRATNSVLICPLAFLFAADFQIVAASLFLMRKSLSSGISLYFPCKGSYRARAGRARVRAQTRLGPKSPYVEATALNFNSRKRMVFTGGFSSTAPSTSLFSDWTSRQKPASSKCRRINRCYRFFVHSHNVALLFQTRSLPIA